MDNVKLFRIDYRLLHWQTGVLWVQKLGADTILVAGDVIAKDEMRKNLIKLAAPKNLTTLILNNKDAVEYLNSEEAKTKKIELLVESTDDALYLVQNVDYLRSLNAALMKTAPGKKIVTKYLALDPNDVDNFNKMLELGVDIQCFTIPTEKKVDIKKYIG